MSVELYVNLKARPDPLIIAGALVEVGTREALQSFKCKEGGEGGCLQ